MRSTPLTHARQALVLATLSQVWEPCLHHCRDEDLGPFVRALDAIRDWALGRMDSAQAATAFAAAKQSIGGTFSAPTRELLESYRAAFGIIDTLTKAVLATSDKEAESAVSFIEFWMSELGADRKEDDLLGAPQPWGTPVESPRGLIVAGGYVWRPAEPGDWSGRFIRRAELTAEESVALDELLERQPAAS